MSTFTSLWSPLPPRWQVLTFDESPLSLACQRSLWTAPKTFKILLPSILVNQNRRYYSDKIHMYLKKKKISWSLHCIAKVWGAWPLFWSLFCLDHPCFSFQSLGSVGFSVHVAQQDFYYFKGYHFGVGICLISDFDK